MFRDVWVVAEAQPGAVESLCLELLLVKLLCEHRVNMKTSMFNSHAVRFGGGDESMRCSLHFHLLRILFTPSDHMSIYRRDVTLNLP